MTASLEQTFRSILDTLEAAVTDRDHGWRIPSLATVTRDETPAQRMVVIRTFDRSTYCSSCVTDHRSDKASEIASNDVVSLLHWDAPSQRQLRVRATAAIVDDVAQIEEAWEKVPDTIRALFASPQVPGSAIADPDEQLASATTATRENFSVVEFKATRFELLELATSPHRRSAYELSEDGYRATWLLP